jgi:hypothetical protein
MTMTQQAPNSNNMYQCIKGVSSFIITIIICITDTCTRVPQPATTCTTHTTPESFTKKSTSDRPHHRPGADFR